MSDPDATLAAIDAALADNDAALRQEQAAAAARVFAEGVQLWRQAIADLWDEVGPVLIEMAEAIQAANRKTSRQWARPPRTINPHGHRAHAAIRRWGGRRG